MQLFCPSCQAAFPGVTRCPRCGGLLLMPHEVSPEAPRRQSAVATPRLQPTIAGRVTVGTILALGLYLGMRKIVMGAVMATTSDPSAWWLSFQALVAVYATQSVAVVFGSIMAAAGRHRGFAHGFLVGAVCGAIFLGYELLAGVPPQALVIYIQPPVLAMLGLVAGVVGARVWGAAPAIAMTVTLPNPSKLSSIQFIAETSNFNSGRPTVWIRVLIGATIMIVGMTMADNAKLFAQRNSAGLLRVQSVGQSEFITWQLATFAVLLGGVAAGAGTGAGIRHGLITGAIGGVAVLGVCLKHGGAIPPIAFWLDIISLDGLVIATPTVCLAVTGGVLLVGLIGGWLGGALFLPIVPEHLTARLRIRD